MPRRRFPRDPAGLNAPPASEDAGSSAGVRLCIDDPPAGHPESGRAPRCRCCQPAGEGPPRSPGGALPVIAGNQPASGMPPMLPARRQCQRIAARLWAARDTARPGARTDPTAFLCVAARPRSENTQCALAHGASLARSTPCALQGEVGADEEAHGLRRGAFRDVHGPSDALPFGARRLGIEPRDARALAPEKVSHPAALAHAEWHRCQRFAIEPTRGI